MTAFTVYEIRADRFTGSPVVASVCVPDDELNVVRAPSEVATELVRHACRSFTSDAALTGVVEGVDLDGSVSIRPVEVGDVVNVLDDFVGATVDALESDTTVAIVLANGERLTDIPTRWLEVVR